MGSQVGFDGCCTGGSSHWGGQCSLKPKSPKRVEAPGKELGDVNTPGGTRASFIPQKEAVGNVSEVSPGRQTQAEGRWGEAQTHEEAFGNDIFFSLFFFLN